MSDTHIGSIYTDVSYIYSAFDKFAERGVDMVCHCGDVFEGMSNRPGHVYELSDIGYSEQLEKGREIFSHWTDTPIYMIDGNHDRWYIKSSGAVIVDALCDGQNNLKYIGHDEGDIKLKGSPATIRLWHGEDGSSYAFSYRIQKIVESFSGGDKPSVLVCGHVHKAYYCFDRNVHCLSAASIQKQSKWMRGKRLAAHTGFWVVELIINKSGVGSMTSTFYPFYA